MVDNPYPPRLLIERVSSGLYRLNLDDSRGIGGCPENGTIFCPDCFGLWAKEDEARALTHREQQACNRQSPERTARFVPIDYSALARALMPKITLQPAAPEAMKWWPSW